MKTLICSVVIFIGINFNSSAQEKSTTENNISFAQCLFTINSIEEMQALELKMRNNPELSVVRLDWNTQRAFMLSKEGHSISKDELMTWFGSYSDSITCIQIGKQGIDPIERYPFTNCKD